MLLTQTARSGTGVLQNAATRQGCSLRLARVPGRPSLPWWVPAAAATFSLHQTCKAWQLPGQVGCLGPPGRRGSVRLSLLAGESAVPARWGWQERERAQPLHITLLCGVLPATLLAHSVYTPHVPPATALHRPPRLGQLLSSYNILGGRAARSELAAGLAAAPRGAVQCARTSLHQCLVSFRGLPGLHRQTLLPLLCLPP